MALHYGDAMVKSVIGTGPDDVDCRKYVLQINDQNFCVDSVNLESLISISIMGTFKFDPSIKVIPAGNDRRRIS